ncbi:hypothetical protein S40285_09410 [Stachybotrys chlorohalonatus IBT 40285]|uniref:2EXR domain-containing protein n=1 Tax=Stachybotrys chlorohalonatus (strain IBT 40285) TaxID=1283841 RepID=A0A084Q814_STAC4|nr:hypothetical protein S40285_09410 [Stachybotrys chlorohalonata IBT 40285]
MSFASLPPELRSQIWILAAEPRRIINMHTQKSGGRFSKKQRQQGKDILYETTATPPPVLMHVCRESRRRAPYRRAFTAGTEPRWTWVNFELDVFCVTNLYSIANIVSHRSEVQRLRIRTDDHPDWYESATNYRVLNILSDFINLTQVQVVLPLGDTTWADVFEWQGFGYCHTDNITFIDQACGLVFTGPQLKLVADWRMVFSFDSAGNPPDADRLSEEIEHALDDTWHLTMAQMRKID